MICTTTHGKAYIEKSFRSVEQFFNSQKNDQKTIQFWSLIQTTSQHQLKLTQRIDHHKVYWTVELS